MEFLEIEISKNQFLYHYKVTNEELDNLLKLVQNNSIITIDNIEYKYKTYYKLNSIYNIIKLERIS